MGARLGQINRSAADVYEEFFVPALFLEPARLVARAGQIRPGQLVLDVACGTGVLARQIAQESGPDCVIGIDRNEGMLSVARRLAPAISWQTGLAETLPFADSVFDRVVSQFGLMFFDDPTKALREMRRVVKTDGRMVVAVWGPLESTPGYAAMVNLLQCLARRLPTRCGRHLHSAIPACCVGCLRMPGREKRRSRRSILLPIFRLWRHGCKPMSKAGLWPI